jgi:glycosyltransferase involved in cell wall biosynthesis
MPLVEALASHVPVIASDLPVFREIAGDVPDYLNPLDGLGWTKKVIEYVSFDSEDRKRQCERIGCFVVPTWSAHFSVVDSFLESMVK